MGALSPATRNAQVAMFQRGEVDYLVATDAIGMGLNMDVTHVAFAGLEKFDGRRDRRLTIPEMAQIAGRAGRHQKRRQLRHAGAGRRRRAGVQRGGDRGDRGASLPPARPSLLAQRRARFHRRRRADRQPRGARATIRCCARRRWRSTSRCSSCSPRIRRSPRARGPAARRLWAACGLPDFRKVGPMHHARMVRRLFSYIGEGGHIPHEWFAAEVARLDNVDGDIEALADRLAGIRSWAYIAQRSDWLADPPRGPSAPGRSRGACRDALHERLTQRFVDRRTAVLVRDIGARGADALPVTVAADGEVSVGPEPIGHLAGFDFRVDPTARLADKRLLLAAAERRLGDELDRRAASPARGARRRVRAGRRGERAGWRSAGRAMSSPGSRPAARCSSRRCARRARSTGCRRRAAPQLRARLEALARRRARPPSSARCASWPRAAADPAAHAGRARAGGDAGRCRRAAAAPRDRRADRRARQGRPPRAAPAAASGSARSTSSSRPCSSPARSAGARRCSRSAPAQPMPRLPDRRRGDARRQRRPARRGARLPPLRIGAGCGSTSPTGSPPTPMPRARPAATTRSTARSSPASGSTTTRVAQADGRSRLRPRRRSLELARHPAAAPPPPGRARAPAMPSPRWPSSSGADVRIDRYLHCIRLVKSRTLAQALIETGHVRIDGRRVAKPSRGRCASAASSPCRLRGRGPGHRGPRLARRAAARRPKRAPPMRRLTKRGRRKT